MRPFVAIVASILMTALPIPASAKERVSATIVITVTIHPRETIASMSQQGDVCASLLIDSPQGYLESDCDHTVGNFEVMQPQSDTLLVEPI